MIFSKNFKKLKMYYKIHTYITMKEPTGGSVGFCIAFLCTIIPNKCFSCSEELEAYMLTKCPELLPYKSTNGCAYWFDPLDYRTRKDILFQIQLDLMNKLTKFDTWWYNNFKFLWV